MLHGARKDPSILESFPSSVIFMKQVLFPSEYRGFLGSNRSRGLLELVLLPQQALPSCLVSFETSNIKVIFSSINLIFLGVDLPVTLLPTCNTSGRAHSMTLTAHNYG